MANTIPFDGILNNSISTNPGMLQNYDKFWFLHDMFVLSWSSDVSNFYLFPDFYNWNRALIAYCDGGSFSSDVEEVDPVRAVMF